MFQGLSILCVKSTYLEKVDLKATSHMSQGLWPRNCEGSWLPSKGHTSGLIDTVCLSFSQAFFLEVGILQIMVDNETLSIVCHEGIHVDFSFMIISLGP
jgi:hypothetical protein